MSSPLEKSKLPGSCSKCSSSSSSPVTADTVTASSKKSKVAGLFSSEDDDSNKKQLQIIINKLEDENKTLKIKNKTLEAAAVVSSTAATALAPTLALAPTESSTILAQFVASVLRDQTLTDLLQEVQQLHGQLRDRNSQILTHEATQELEKIRFLDLMDTFGNINDDNNAGNNAGNNARGTRAVLEAFRQYLVEHPLYQEFVENNHN